MDHIQRAIEKQKQPLPGDQPQQAAPPPSEGQPQPQQQAAPASQPQPEAEHHHHGKQVVGGLAKAGEFGFGASLGGAAANSVIGAFKG